MRLAFLLSIFCLLLNHHALAAPDISGAWTLYESDSDNLVRAFKSQVKKAQRKSVRNGGAGRGQAPAGIRAPVLKTTLLMRTLPYFLHQSNNININQEEVLITFDHDSQVRRKVFTDERPTTISLLAAGRGEHDVRVSGWEGKRLFIETTSTLDVKIQEVYELLPGEFKQLKNTVTIRHPLFRQPLTIELFYRLFGP